MIGKISTQSGKKTQTSLERILERQGQSTNVQVSAVQILNFLVNDMLDYAQLSAGQFRKFMTRFDVFDTFTEVIDVMRFKADELGVKMETRFENFPAMPTFSTSDLTSRKTNNKYMIRFDK